MAYEFKYRRRVEFADTDMAGICHFANFFRYVEEAEHAFLRSLGASVHTATDDGFVSFPRVSVECRFESPIRFEDEVEVHLLVRQKNARSITYDFVCRTTDAEARQAAHGSMTVVCVAKGPGDEAMKATAIPDALASLIEPAPPELLQNS